MDKSVKIFRIIVLLFFFKRQKKNLFSKVSLWNEFNNFEILTVFLTYRLFAMCLLNIGWFKI